MPSSKWFLFALFLAWEGLGGQALRAQCLPLAKLRASVAAGRITPDSLQALLPRGEWELHPGENPYWTHHVPGQPLSEAEDGSEAWVGLRRSTNQRYYDLVYKTTRHECIAQLRNAFKRHTNLKPEYVNCVSCEAERLIGEDFTVTIFNQKASYMAQHTPYPFVLVLRRAVGGGSPSPPAADALLQPAPDQR